METGDCITCSGKLAVLKKTRNAPTSVKINANKT